ncbi:MAG: hypothetical protein KGZ49_09595 [Syntrophaceae bacterium]|nr:hypothetical protein [Syntrophaceae bacterium]
MAGEGFSLRIGLQCNTDPETQPEGCGYKEIRFENLFLTLIKSILPKNSPAHGACLREGGGII